MAKNTLIITDDIELVKRCTRVFGDVKTDMSHERLILKIDDDLTVMGITNDVERRTAGAEFDRVVLLGDYADDHPMVQACHRIARSNVGNLPQMHPAAKPLLEYKAAQVGDLVKIEWTDSANHAIDWTENSELEEIHQFATIETFGIVARINDSGVTVIQSTCVAGPGNGSSNNGISIPKGCVNTLSIIRKAANA